MLVVSPAVPDALARRRAVARELCLAHPRAAHRATTAEQLRGVGAAAAALVWLDLGEGARSGPPRGRLSALSVFL